MADSTTIAYDKLCICTGAVPKVMNKTRCAHNYVPIFYMYPLPITYLRGSSKEMLLGQCAEYVIDCACVVSIYVIVSTLTGFPLVGNSEGPP